MYKHVKIIAAIVFSYSPTIIADQYKQISVGQCNPSMVVALMIKDEAPVINDTLRPLATGGIDSYLIYDTGSTDDTIEKVVEFFRTYSITNFAIIQEEWMDFSRSRNRALDLVDQYFPEATFVFMPDAEWIVHNVNELLNFCHENKTDFYASYLMRMLGSLDFAQNRLMRRESHCRFDDRGAHECLTSPSTGSVPRHIYIEYNPTQYGVEKSRKRWTRDIGILLKEYAKNPTDARTVFYLAQTYSCLGDLENAFRFYELRTQLLSWEEENYMAMYRLAEIAKKLAEKDSDNKTAYDWSLAQWYYIKAFSMHPTRIEPLIHIALHYLDNQDYVNAFMFAERAAEIPYPEQDILFIETEMYNFTRYYIIAQCGLKIGELAKGEWAIKKALEYKPKDENLLELLAQYISQ